MAKYTYTVNITRKVTSVGVFEVTSKTKLTEDDLHELAMTKAQEGEDPQDGWEDTDTDYEDPQTEDGAEDLKHE